MLINNNLWLINKPAEGHTPVDANVKRTKSRHDLALCINCAKLNDISLAWKLLFDKKLYPKLFLSWKLNRMNLVFKKLILILLNKSLTKYYSFFINIGKKN